MTEDNQRSPRQGLARERTAQAQRASFQATQQQRENPKRCTIIS
jgi:hypothetical protein